MDSNDELQALVVTDIPYFSVNSNGILQALVTTDPLKLEWCVVSFIDN